MKALYPAPANPQPLPDHALALRIARYSPCQSCDCRGARPPAGCEVMLDSDFEEDLMLLGLTEDVFDDGELNATYIEICDCGHSVRNHNADPSVLGQDEFLRRHRVADRMDELRKVCICRIFIMCPDESNIGWLQVHIAI